MCRPIIGITTGRTNPATPRDEIQTPTMGCALEYPLEVIRAGGAPVLLPRTGDSPVVESLIEAIDGLLLSGGGDIVSLAYGEEPHPKCRYQDPVRDEMERQAIRLAIARGLPILGICRGLQSLNVALGGSLIQDIPSELPDAIQHYTHERECLLGHTVQIEAATLLERVLGSGAQAVNSYHHQALKTVADGFRVNCRAPDGVIEGIEAADGRPVIGVQFHPEDCAEHYPGFRELFGWLVRSAEAQRRTGRPVVASAKHN